MDFRVGDRVVAIRPVDGYSNLIGKTGTVLYIHEKGVPRVGVEFDEPFDGGHNCGGRGKTGYCRFGSDNDFALDLPELMVSDDDRKSLDNFLLEFNVV